MVYIKKAAGYNNTDNKQEAGQTETTQKGRIFMDEENGKLIMSGEFSLDELEEDDFDELVDTPRSVEADESTSRFARLLQQTNIFRQIATVEKVSDGDLKLIVPTEDGSDAFWPETVKKRMFYEETPDDFTLLTLTPHRLGAEVIIPSDIQAQFNSKGADKFLPPLDTKGRAGLLSLEAAKKIGRAEERAFILGDGNGQPTGFLQDLAPYAQCQLSKLTKSIIRLFHSVDARFREQSVWLMSEGLLATLKQQSEGYNVFSECTLPLPRRYRDEFSRDYDCYPENFETIMGRPVVTSQFMPGNIAAFGDFTQYVIADAGKLAMKKLESSEYGFYFEIAVDGKLTNPNAIKLLKVI